MGEYPALSAQEIDDIAAQREQQRPAAAVDVSNMEWLACWAS